MTALHHQLGLIGATICLLTLALFAWEQVRIVRLNREQKRKRLAEIFDGVRPFRK